MQEIRQATQDLKVEVATTLAQVKNMNSPDHIKLGTLYGYMKTIEMRLKMIADEALRKERLQSHLKLNSLTISDNEAELVY